MTTPTSNKNHILIEVIENASNNPDLPALGKATLRLAELDEDKGNLDELIDIVLSDPALAQKVMRASQMANMVKWGGGNNNITMAIMSLGINQVKSMAIALNIMAASNQSLVDKSFLKKIMHQALCSAFCAKEIAKSKKINYEENALRTLFFASAPILCAIYHPPTFIQVQSRMEQENESFSVAFKNITGFTDYFFIDRLIKAWGLADHLRTPFLKAGDYFEKRLIHVSNETSIAFCQDDEELFFEQVEHLFKGDFDDFKKSALIGLEKGRQLAVFCGVVPKKLQPQDLSASSTLTKHETLKLEPPTQEKSVFIHAPIKVENRVLDDSVIQVPQPSDIDPIIHQLTLASSQMVQQCFNPAITVNKTQISQFAMQALLKAFGMKWALCAYGGGQPKEASLLSYHGNHRRWATQFIECRQKGRFDLFSHALENGLDIYTYNAKSLKASLPSEITPESHNPMSFVFIPLSFKGKTKGYLLLSSDEPVHKLQDTQYQMAKNLCAQMMLCFLALA